MNMKLTFLNPATPIAEGIMDLHHSIFFFLLLILVPVLFMFMRILENGYYGYSYPTIIHISLFRKNYLNTVNLTHGTLLEIVWTITPAIILMAIALPASFSICLGEAHLNMCQLHGFSNYGIKMDFPECFTEISTTRISQEEIMSKATFGHTESYIDVKSGTLKSAMPQLKDLTSVGRWDARSAFLAYKSLQNISPVNPKVLPFLMTAPTPSHFLTLWDSAVLFENSMNPKCVTSQEFLFLRDLDPNSFIFAPGKSLHQILPPNHPNPQNLLFLKNSKFIYFNTLTSEEKILFIRKSNEVHNRICALRATKMGAEVLSFTYENKK